MRLGVLGSLLVVDDEGRHVPMPAPRLRVMLAALLLHADSPLPADSLAELVWDGAPPAGAAITLRTYVRRLRTGLGPAWAQRIVTRPPGYLCRADEQEVDVLRFEALCKQTDTAVRERRWAQAAQAAELAGSLWRGAPLLDVPCRILHDEFTPRLEQLRTQVQENRAEAALALGHHEEWVQPLTELVAAHPLRERFHAQLMQALARSGRQAEALAAYHDARNVLVEELGIEPGPELRQLHKRILAGDGDLAAPRPSISPALEAAPSPAAPRQLPAAARHFTGRRRELDQILDLLGSSQSTDVPGGTVVISAIDGMAGIGKTTLAIHAAHRLAESFPDGQLFLDLRGHTEGQRPRTPAQALTWLLRALGVPPAQIPKEREQAAALYRQRLADSRTLIVLDNAATEAQVRPLLPGGGSCLMLITSRRRLRGLEDAHTLSLDLLPAPDAIALLRAVAGADRVPADDRLLGEVAELCGYLPLALRIAASLLRHRPAWNLEDLAELLRDQRQRVTALSDGERRLATIFDMSYTSIDEIHRRLWRRLGLIPGPDLDAFAAAALLDVDRATAAGLLEDLVDHNLLTAYTPGRYRLHDLLRAHAYTLAPTDPAPERVAAEDRLLHYYAHTAQRASVRVARYPRPEPGGPAPADAPALTDQDAARAWLRTEQPNLDAAFTHAHGHGLDDHMIALAAGLAEILQTDGPWPRAFEMHQTAAETAERLGHRVAQADALSNLGGMRYMAGDFAKAGDVVTRALEIYRELGHRLGEANALNDLARVRYLTDDYPGADDAVTRALEIYRELGHRLGEANALDDLGRVRLLTGDYAAAGDAYAQAFDIYREHGHRHGEATALTHLGHVAYQLADYPGAGDAHTRALAVYRELGHRNGEVNALNDLGRVRALTGDYPGADDALTRALEIYRELGHRHGEANALTDLGRVRYLTGDYPGADEADTQAFEIYRALGNRHGEAYALTDLGRVRTLIGDYLGSDDALTRALETYRELGQRDNEAWALNYYAANFAATGRRDRALELYRQALAMNRELSKPDDEAVSLEGIAEHHLATGDPAQGAVYLHQALEIYQRLGMPPDARRVQERLKSMTPA
jgi:DNA-binding SARP family transcriptional activator/tetratricopeptide (TPR) repeat protein